MDYKNIAQLLEKYWEGETSLQEEATLKQYFNQEKVAEELQQYQPLFQFFKEEQDMSISDDFEKRLLEQIQNESSVKIRKLNWMTSIRNIAAVAVILFGAFFLLKNINQTPVKPIAQGATVKIIDDEMEAYQATKAALLLLSGKIKKGSKKAVKGLEEVKDGTRHAMTGR